MFDFYSVIAVGSVDISYTYISRLIKPSSGIWLVYIHLCSSASIPTLASVHMLEVVYKNVFTSNIKY
jgi:hypothetical protein